MAAATPFAPVETPSRRRRPLLIAGIATAAVVVVAAGLAVALYPREDSGVVACRRLDEFTRTFNAGEQPRVAEEEARNLADMLAGSGHESLSRLGEALQYGFEKDAAEGTEFNEFRGALTMTGISTACDRAGVPMTRMIPQR